MIRVVVAIVLLQRLQGHPQKTTGVPLGRALLHEPSSAGVPQGMWNNFPVSLCLETSRHNSGSKRTLDVLQRLAAMSEDEFVFRKSPSPAQQVLPQARWQSRARALLLGSPTPNWIPVNDVAVEIDIRPTQRKDRLLPLAGQHANPEKQGQVLGFTLRRNAIFNRGVEASRGPDQLYRLIARQKPDTPLGLWREANGNFARNQLIFFRTADSRRQQAEFSSKRAIFEPFVAAALPPLLAVFLYERVADIADGIAIEKPDDWLGRIS